MTLEFEIDEVFDGNEELFPWGDPIETAENVLNETLDVLECPFEATVSLLITDNDSIHEINKEQRGIDSPTDVLSFPFNDYVKPADFDAIENDMNAFHPESGELMLGDIVISIDRVREQAKEYGHSEKREYAFLIAHSLLHLSGFDHMTPEEAEVMENYQNQILNNLGITREAMN